jgi:hypothetical protein
MSLNEVQQPTTRKSLMTSKITQEKKPLSDDDERGWNAKHREKIIITDY